MNYTQRTTNKCKQFIEPFGQKHILSLRKIVDLFHQHNISVLADTCFQMLVEKDKKNKNYKKELQRPGFIYKVI